MPGVVAVTTGPSWWPPASSPFRTAPTSKRAGGAPWRQPARRVLAHERVRYVARGRGPGGGGNGAAGTRRQAEAVMVDYDELPHVVTADDATAAGAPALCDEAPDNVSAEMRHGNEAATAEAFAKAAHIVKLNIDNQRVAALTIEPRSVLARGSPKTAA